MAVSPAPLAQPSRSQATDKGDPPLVSIEAQRSKAGWSTKRASLPALPTSQSRLSSPISYGNKLVFTVQRVSHPWPRANRKPSVADFSPALPSLG